MLWAAARQPVPPASHRHPQGESVRRCRLAAQSEARSRPQVQAHAEGSCRLAHIYPIYIQTIYIQIQRFRCRIAPDYAPDRYGMSAPQGGRSRAWSRAIVSLNTSGSKGMWDTSTCVLTRLTKSVQGSQGACTCIQHGTMWLPVGSFAAPSAGTLHSSLPAERFLLSTTIPSGELAQPILLLAHKDASRRHGCANRALICQNRPRFKSVASRHG